MGTQKTNRVTRRRLLGSAAVIVASYTTSAAARSITGNVPWTPFAASQPETGWNGAWRFFTEAEARAVGAVAEVLIPADDLSVSGKDAGCVEFIDGQLAGSYGTSERLYMRGPFREGALEQGDQFPWTMRDRYRLGLAALSQYCQKTFQKEFADLDTDSRTKVLKGLEAGEITLSPVPAKVFFKQLLDTTMEGFFADPIYGGNRDMVSWKMIGFPGARYDYRPYLSKHNQKLDLEPVSIAGRPAWSKTEAN